MPNCDFSATSTYILLNIKVLYSLVNDTKVMFHLKTNVCIIVYVVESYISYMNIIRK